MRFLRERTVALCAWQKSRRVQALSLKNVDPQIARREAIFLLNLASFAAMQGQSQAMMPELDVGFEGFKSADLIPTEDVNRVIAAVQALPDVLSQYSYLADVRNSKGGVFFAALELHPELLLPVVYTPGIGDACLNWGRLSAKPRALVLSYEDRGNVAKKMKDFKSDASVVVVTDGQRILGLGDLGANGVGISVGKAQLYSGASGVPPDDVLPVALDVGCDNSSLRSSPEYIGKQQDRLQGEEYEAFVNEFHTACQNLYGKQCLVHWEDFGPRNARVLLERYRRQGPTFNDDIQSTAAVVLACVLGAARRASVPPLTQQTFVFAGAGQSSLGSAALLVSALVDEGLTEAEARSRIWIFDTKGLIAEGREGLSTYKQEYAQSAVMLKQVRLKPGASLGHAVRMIKPTCLVGATGKAGVFTPEILKDVYKGMPSSKVLATANVTNSSDSVVDGSGGRKKQRGEGLYASMPPGSGGAASLRATPIVLALSNPTSCSECTLQDALDAMDGNCIFASGSPFPAASGVDGVSVEASQANNAMIFPGLGSGAILSGASEIPPSCFLEAGRALAEELSESELVSGLAIPPVSRIRDAALAVTAAVCIECQQTMVSSMVASDAGNSKVWRQAVAVLESEKGGDVVDVEARAILRRQIADCRY